jgi:hypothetical protein
MTDHLLDLARDIDQQDGPQYDADPHPLIAGLEVAMLGTTDGELIDPDSDIPAGEMFRLAAEYIEGAIAEHDRQVAERTFDEINGRWGFTYDSSNPYRKQEPNGKEPGNG